MKRIFAFLLFIIPSIFLFVQSRGQQPLNNRTIARLGVSEVNITPDLPVIMSGYDARKTPSTGVHDSLFASALYFSGVKTKALLITADLIGFPHAFVDSTKQMISSKTGIAPDHIMMIATHNHSGPAIRTYENDLPSSNADYIRSLKEKLMSVASDAMKKPVPFRMGIGKGKCNLNINRRAKFADGGVWLGRNPDGACDHELDVVKFVDEKDDLLAVLLNWPCHGTTGGQENYKITGDWPSAAARYIKKKSGKEFVVAVTAGASADINPIYGPGNDFDEVEAVGYHVANEAWEPLTKAKTSPVNSISIAYSLLRLPEKKAWNDQFPQESVASGNKVDIRLAGLKIGDLVILGISGELMTEIGMLIKKESRYQNTTIVTHCNGSSGYICTDKAFAEGGYETKVSRLMPGIEKKLVNTCLQMIHSF